MGTHEISVTKLFGRRRTVVPSELCRKWGLTDGDRIVWLEDDGNGQIIVKPSKPSKGRFLPATK